MEEKKIQSKEVNKELTKKMEKAKIEVIRIEGIDILTTSDTPMFGATHWW